VVVAGGSGSRFGSPKQFLQLDGRPVVAWSVAAARPVGDGVVVVVPATPGPNTDGSDARAWGADLVVAGGDSRAASVRAGLAAVPASASVIVVHDAARPLAPPSLFAEVVAALAAGTADGVIPVLPVSDTLKRVSGDQLEATVDRTGLVAVQTPQAFVAAVLRAAHASGQDATDDAGLLEATGATVRTVAGDPRNVKLTHPEDLAVAQALLSTAPVPR
jgi:2-C-methyl-D-erythritol 4-phosphate cytidylyltransferase